MVTIAFVALAWLLPFRDIPVVLSEPTVRIFDVAAIPAIVVAGLVLAFNRRAVLSPGVALIVPLALAQLLFSASQGIWSKGEPYLIVRAVVWTMYCSALFVTASTFAQLLPRRRVIGHLLASLIAANLIASLIFWFAPGVMTIWAGGISMEGEGVDVLRFPGFASEPNYWGSLLLVLFPVAWATIMSRTVRRNLGLGLPVAGLLLFAGLATFSTFTQLAVGVAAVLVILFGLPGHRLGPVLTSVLVAIGAALLVLTVQGYGDYVLDKLTTYTTGTNSERYHAGLAAVRMWLEAPLFGFGLGAYPTHYQDFADVQMLPVESAHSVVLATLAEQGLVGLTVLALLLVALLGIGEARVRLAWQQDITVRLLFLGLILYIGFLGITGNLYLYYFWFYAGLHHGLAIQSVKLAGSDPVPRVTRRMAPA